MNYPIILLAISLVITVGICNYLLIKQTLEIVTNIRQFLSTIEKKPFKSTIEKKEKVEIKKRKVYDPKKDEDKLLDGKVDIYNFD